MPLFWIISLKPSNKPPICHLKIAMPPNTLPPLLAVDNTGLPTSKAVGSHMVGIFYVSQPSGCLGWVPRLYQTKPVWRLLFQGPPFKGLGGNHQHNERSKAAMVQIDRVREETCNQPREPQGQPIYHMRDV